MFQVIEQTEEEKVEMYMKCNKRELVGMLLENQRLLAYHHQSMRRSEPGAGRTTTLGATGETPEWLKSLT